MYRVSPFTYLIEGLLGQGMFGKSGIFLVSANSDVFYQPSVVNEFTALRRNWQECNLPIRSPVAIT